MDALGVRQSNLTRNEDIKNQLLEVYNELGNLNEVNWSKIRDMAFNEAREARQIAAGKIATSHSLECPDFLEHVQYFHIKG